MKSRITVFIALITGLLIISSCKHSVDYQKAIVGTWKMDTSYFLFYNGQKQISLKEFYPYVMNTYSKQIQILSDTLSKIQASGKDTLFVKYLEARLQQLQMAYQQYQDYSVFEKSFTAQNQANNKLEFQFNEDGSLLLLPDNIKGKWAIKDTTGGKYLDLIIGNYTQSSKIVKLTKNLLVLHDSSALDSSYSLVVALEFKKLIEK